MRKTRKNWLDRLFTHLSNLLFLLTVTGLIVVIGWTSHIAYDAIWGPDPPIVIASTVVHPRPKTHQVMPGDTVWSIYVKYYQGYDWEEIRYKIGELNDLKNDMLRAHAVIKLPEVD